MHTKFEWDQNKNTENLQKLHNKDFLSLPEIDIVVIQEVKRNINKLVEESIKQLKI